VDARLRGHDGAPAVTAYAGIALRSALFPLLFALFFSLFPIVLFIVPIVLAPAAFSSLSQGLAL
jgi:hypothetical protein